MADDLTNGENIMAWLDNCAIYYYSCVVVVTWLTIMTCVCLIEASSDDQFHLLQSPAVTEIDQLSWYSDAHYSIRRY